MFLTSIKYEDNLFFAHFFLFISKNMINLIVYLNKDPYKNVP